MTEMGVKKIYLNASIDVLRTVSGLGVDFFLGKDFVRCFLQSLLCLLICVVGSTATAQSESGQTDFSLFGGYLLPSQIQNVTDILPLFGARYAYNFTSVALEFEAENAHAQGVDWTQAALSFRVSMPVDTGLEALLYAGPDAIWYIPNGDTSRLLDLGFHVGVAGIAQIKDSLWLRADLKYLGNPGSSLYILAGLMFRPSGGL
jgi:hypothetical protein